jgi:hypothetical protein
MRRRRVGAVGLPADMNVLQLFGHDRLRLATLAGIETVFVLALVIWYVIWPDRPNHSNRRKEDTMEFLKSLKLGPARIAIIAVVVFVIALLVFSFVLK